MVGTALLVALLAPMAPAAGQIVDGTSPQGRQGFYFLPPMVPDPGVTGNFDASLTPEADICVLNADRTGCSSTNVAELDTAMRRSWGGIYVHAGSGSYNAAWRDTKKLAVSRDAASNPRYRLEIFQTVGTQRVRLGFADLWVVSQARKLRTKPDGYVGVVRGKPFVIRFRIQTTAVGLVSVTPDPATMLTSETEQLTAEVLDLHGDPMAGRTVGWATDPAGVATLAPASSTTDAAGQATTTATPAAAGTTSVSATTGGATGSATLHVHRLPAPQDDPYETPAGQVLQVPAAGVLSNDDLGHPPATLASFGGGTLGGAVTDNAPGATATVDGHAVTLNADGSLHYTPKAGFVGDITFSYRLTNAGGSADAVVTIAVTATAPDPADDDLVTAVGTVLAADVTANNGHGADVLGVPPGTVASFGGGSLSGDAGTHAAGTTVPLAGGTLSLAADGALSLTGHTLAGQYTFAYRVTNTHGSGDATVTITVQQAPDANNDAVAVLPGAAISGDVFADTGAGADDRGIPQGDVVSFGGGDLGGTVDTNTAGTSATLGDGSVSIATNGALSGTAPTTTGTYSFDYRLTNAAGSDTATVTLTVQRPPTAAADAFTTTVGGATLTGDLYANNGSGADDLGDPPGTVTSFGGGSLSASVTDHAAGASATLAGGTLTVGSDGALSLTGATTGGNYTFAYRLANSAGASDATVTITVNQPPTAVADAPSATSAPGEAWHTAFNTALDTATHATPSVLANDTLGFPAATLTHFGGGAGGTVTDHTAGTTATIDGHSLTMGPDGNLVFTPTAGFTGLATFSYRIANAGGTSDATVTIAVGERPAAAADTYPHTLVGNLGVDTATGTPFSVLTNDTGDGVTVTAGAPTNGDVTVNPDGTFTFDPAAGFRGGTASFTYTVTNGFGASAPATVSIPVGGQVIWFVDNTAPACTTLAANCGRLSSPLSTLAAFHTLNTGGGNNPADNHHVFLYESASPHAGPVTLRNGQRLIGQDATASLASLSGVTLPAHSPALPAMNTGAPTTMITSAADAVTLGQGNRLHGFRLGDAAGTALSGTGFGTLVVSDVTIDNATGQALNLANGTAGSPFAFTSVTSGGGTNNIRLAAGGGVLAGTFHLPGGTLSGSTGDAFVVDGGTAAVTYTGTITNTAGRSVSVGNTTGGTVTLSGAISDTGSGIDLAANPGATIALTGPLTLDTPATGFSATGGGTVRAPNAANTLAATAGPALRIQGTAIHADGVRFASIASTGGTNGIVLDGTGAAGGLTVTGTGTAGSGGTIQGASGDGLALSSTSHVALDRMVIQDHFGSGINGTAVTGFALANSTVNGNGDDVATDEAGIRFTNLHGTASLTNTTVAGSIEDNARVINTSGTLALAVTGSTIRDTNSGGNNGLLVQASGTASITAGIHGSSFLRNRANGVQVATNDAGTIDVDLGTTTANTFSDNNIGVSIAHNSSGTLTYDVANSTFNAPTKTDAASPINLNLAGFGNVMSGTVANNTISNNNSLVGPGIRVISNGAGTMTVALSNNSITQVGNYGIETLARDGSSTINATYTGNTITLNDAFALDGMRVSAGGVSTDTTSVCADLAGNTVSTPAPFKDIRVRNRFTGTSFQLEGYAGSATDMAAVAAYLTGRNTITTAAADHSGNAGFLNSAGCPTP